VCRGGRSFKRRRFLAVAGAFVAVAAVGLAAVPAGAQLPPRFGLAEGLNANVTYMPTRAHANFGPAPRVSVGPEPGTRGQSLSNFNLPVGTDAFTAADMLVTTDSNFSNHIESAATLSNFDLIGFTGDQILTECDARTNQASGTTTLTNVRAQGTPLPTNPAPNTKIEFTSSSFTVYLNEQHTTGAGGSRIEITALRVVFQAGDDFRGSFSFGHIVCDFGSTASSQHAP